jgi:hypothetical protein
MKGRASTLVSAAENIELRHIERTMKLKIERRKLQDLNQDLPSAATQREIRETNTLTTRTLLRLPGEVFA